MTRINDRQLFTLALLAFALVILYATAGLSAVGRLVPLAVLVPTLGLLLFQLCLDLAPGFVRKHSLLEQKDVFGIEEMRLKAPKKRRTPGPRVVPGVERVSLVAFLPGLMYLLGVIALPYF